MSRAKLYTINVMSAMQATLVVFIAIMAVSMGLNQIQSEHRIAKIEQSIEALTKQIQELK